MQPNKMVEKHVNRILSLVCVLLIMVVVALKFDYYYELNDDVLIKDILAGVYTGMPEGRNIQMLWPLSAVLSLLYRLVRFVPWYGLFLCGVQYLCIFLILNRSFRFVKRLRAKIAIAAVLSILVVGLFLEHLVMVQYTITAAFMAAAAAYLFYTLPSDLQGLKLLKGSIPSLLLVMTAYCLRPNMMLLLLPMVAVTGILRWSREEKPFAKENFQKYLPVAAAILAVMGLCYLADMAAYSDPEWKAFNTLFDNRTELYDFQTIPSFEEHKNFYASIGMKESEQALLVNYNYGLDPAITETTIGEVAAYAKEMKDAAFSARFREAVKQYVYRSLHEEDYPWNLITWLVYLAVLLTILMRKEGGFIENMLVAIFRLGSVFLVRTLLWMYILVNGRCPVRISHSLYLMEICILIAVLIVEYTRKLREKEFMILITGCFFLCALLILIPFRVVGVSQKCEKQDEVDAYGKAIDAYCSARTDRFYYVDVYSTIVEGMSFSDKMFTGVDNTYENYDLLGGWACNSPLYRKKAAQMGLNGPYKDFLESDKVYLICELSASTDWLTNFYEDMGTEVSIELADNIEGYYGVYRIRPKK